MLHATGTVTATWTFTGAVTVTCTGKIIFTGVVVVTVSGSMTDTGTVTGAVTDVIFTGSLLIYCGSILMLITVQNLNQ